MSSRDQSKYGHRIKQDQSKVFGTLEGDNAAVEALDVGVVELSHLDFSNTRGIVLPLKIRFVDPVDDLIIGAADDPGDNGLGLATITPGIGFEGCKKILNMKFQLTVINYKYIMK